VKFSARGSGYGLCLTQAEALLAINKGLPQKTARTSGDEQESSLASQTKQAAPSVLRMRLKGTNPDARIAGTAELAGKVNFPNRGWEQRCSYFVFLIPL
jgi:hypothetical protein